MQDRDATSIGGNLQRRAIAFGVIKIGVGAVRKKEFCKFFVSTAHCLPESSSSARDRKCLVSVLDKSVWVRAERKKSLCFVVVPLLGRAKQRRFSVMVWNVCVWVRRRNLDLLLAARTNDGRTNSVRIDFEFARTIRALELKWFR